MLDQCVGRILDELKTQGIYDDSLILFTSDHGEMLGSHGLFQKMCMYEESARVPLSIKFPKGTAVEANSIKQSVSHIDVLPTLCDYLQIPLKNPVDGTSLMPLITGKAEEQPEHEVFIQYDGNGSRSNFQRCMVKGSCKLIVDLFKDEAFYELYDVDKDPQETENLMFDPEFDRIAAEMTEKLAAHMTATGDLLTLIPCTPAEFRAKYEPFPVL